MKRLQEEREAKIDRKVLMRVADASYHQGLFLQELMADVVKLACGGVEADICFDLVRKFNRAPEVQVPKLTEDGKPGHETKPGGIAAAVEEYGRQLSERVNARIAQQAEAAKQASLADAAEQLSTQVPHNERKQ